VIQTTTELHPRFMERKLKPEAGETKPEEYSFLLFKGLFLFLLLQMSVHHSEK
jgi:hypothetical protein